MNLINDGVLEESTKNQKKPVDMDTKTKNSESLPEEHGDALTEQEQEIKEDRKHAQHTRKGWQEYLDEQEKEKEDYNLQAKRMGWTYKTAYGILIPGPNFLPNFDYTDEWMISDELWQTWTAKEKVDWVIRHS